MGRMLIAIYVTVFFTAGCYPMMGRVPMRGQNVEERKALEAADELDKIASDLEEYGSITASSFSRSALFKDFRQFGVTRNSLFEWQLRWRC
jgi:hypothetical protein